MLQKIRHSKILNWIYCQWADFNHGKNFISKFTSMSGEINTVLLLILGWNTFKEKFSQIFLWAILGLTLIFLFGKMYRKSNVLEVEQRAAISRSPVDKLHLEATEIIIDRFGRNKDELIR